MIKWVVYCAQPGMVIIVTIHYIMGSSAIEFDLKLACIYHVYTDKVNYFFQFSEIIYPCMISDS